MAFIPDDESPAQSAEVEKCKICGKNVKGKGEYRHCPLGHFPENAQAMEFAHAMALIDSEIPTLPGDALKAWETISAHLQQLQEFAELMFTISDWHPDYPTDMRKVIQSAMEMAHDVLYPQEKDAD